MASNVTLCSFDHQCQHLAVVSADGNIRVWSVEGNKKIWEKSLGPHPSSALHWLSSEKLISKRGKILAIGSDAGTITLTLPLEGKTLTTFTAHTLRVAAIANSALSIFSTSEDRETKMWDLSGKLVE